MKARWIIALAVGLLVPGMTQAAEIKLLGSGALKEAYLELLPQFEQASGHKVAAQWLSTPEVHKRIASGEAADLVILADNATQELMQQGKLAPGNRILRKIGHRRRGACRRAQARHRLPRRAETIAARS